MLLFSSTVRLSSNVGLPDILSMLNDWFLQSGMGKRWLSDKLGSPFDVYDAAQEEYRESSSSGVTVDILNNMSVPFGTSGAFLVQFLSDQDGWLQDTFCILRDVPGGPMLFYVGESFEQKQPFASLPPCPGKDAGDILRRLFWCEYQEQEDGCIEDIGAPILLNRKALADYKPLFSGEDAAFQRPYLYLLHQDASLAQQLSDEFIGRVHVFAELSPALHGQWTDIVGTPCPDGVSSLHFPDGTVVPLSGSTADIPSGARAVLQDNLRTHEPDPMFDIPHIREERLLAKIDGNSEISSAFESILADKDAEIGALKQEVSNLKERLYGEKAKSGALKEGLEKFDAPVQASMFEMTEKPLYDHEFEDIILRVLEKERMSMDSSQPLVKSRKYHVLCDILAHNFPSGTGTAFQSLLKEVFADGRLTRDGIGRLQAAGFTVERGGRQSHYYICFRGDERYATTYAATPSDFRSGRNNASEFSNQCFGY